MTKRKRIKTTNENIRRVSPEEIAALGGKVLCPPCGRLLEKRLVMHIDTSHAPCKAPSCGCACQTPGPN